MKDTQNSVAAKNHANLMAVSPIDGRYADKTQVLADYFSEYALQKARIQIEIAWLIFLCETQELAEIPSLSMQAKKLLNAIHANFNLLQAQQVKSFEAITNHDVKAIEYFIKEQMRQHDELKPLVEYVHFACTSEDINNLAYARLLTKARVEVLLPHWQSVLQQLSDLGRKHADLSMLARTHGQPATPTTMGKEIINFTARLQSAVTSIQNITLTGKLNGATGNFNAHHIAFPEVNWISLSEQFIQSLDLIPHLYTTQIEPMDHVCELLHAIARCNSILIDFCRDIWAYISLGYFVQSKKEEEVGSSTMPHKINPIDFENAEGNFSLANALLSYFAQQLPLSRWQRDLVNSTVQRNIGVAFAHTLIALLSLSKGLGKLTVNNTLIEQELAKHPEVLTEAVQTVMRRYGFHDGYEQLKAQSRGTTLTLTSLRQFIQNLALPEDVKQNLLQLTPKDYCGLANELVLRFTDE